MNEIGKIGPANIMKHLKGLKYPASKNAAVEKAKEHNEPISEEVVQLLEKIPDREYKTPAEIMKEIGRVK